MVGGPFTVACVQTTSGLDIAANIDAAQALVRDAAKAGADFVLLPETVNLMELDRHARDEKKITVKDIPLPSPSIDLASSSLRCEAKVPPPSAVEPMDPEKSTT